MNDIPVEQNNTVQDSLFSKKYSLAGGERWFVARVHPNRETSAQFNLQRLGFRVFAPMIGRTVRHARKLRQVRAPLFPGYVFLILDLSRDRWRVVNSTFGVASLLMGAEQPTPVPRGIVEAFAISGNSELIRSDAALEIGQKVRILSGPFADALCRLVDLDDKGRIRVLLEIMGTEVAVQLDRSRVAPAGRERRHTG